MLVQVHAVRCRHAEQALVLEGVVRVVVGAGVPEASAPQPAWVLAGAWLHKCGMHVCMSVGRGMGTPECDAWVHGYWQGHGCTGVGCKGTAAAV